MKSQRQRTLTPWELPQLLIPMHHHKQPTLADSGKERPHFCGILGYVYRNRYVVASQIQRRFSHWLKSDRTTRRHLAEMQALGYLGVAPTRSTSPLWPKVYYITQGGARRLRQALAARSKQGDVVRSDRTRTNGYAADHVLHEVLTTEFLLAVWQTIHASNNLDLCQIERRSLAGNPAFQLTLGRRHTRLEPDAMFVHREQGSGLICSFVELDTGSMRLQQMTAKFGRYEAWAHSDVGKAFLCDLYRRHAARKPRPVFRVLTIAATQANGDGRVADLMSIATAFPTKRVRRWVPPAPGMIRFCPTCRCPSGRLLALMISSTGTP
ncbi:MAG: replication-relaxation family protein [Planctomycetes bacterium]|nr:replication-relaxation family protein [Planctomycetota bacterium]